jgi:secreted trypsin-like serine protease
MILPQSTLAALAILLVLSSPSSALVGGAEPAGAAIARHLVMIVGSRGNFCSGAAVARDLVITAAHCVLPGADYKLIETKPDGAPTLHDVKEIARHPQFSLQTLQAHRATADIALLKLARPLPAAFAPARLSDPSAVAAGDRFTVAGYGVAVSGDGKTSGKARVAPLVATGRPGNLQIRLVDPAGRNERAGLGACTGDSGGPVFADRSGSIIGVVSWSTGAGNRAGCGGLTGVTPLSLHGDWILQTARRLGSPLP